jgi:cation diffusion facilitator family transporter
MRFSKCVFCYESVGWIGLVSNLALAALKLFVGLISGSHALVADSLYSAKDVVTSGLLIVGLKVAKKEVDKEHPYGHGKIEFILAGVMSVVFIAATALVFYLSVGRLLGGEGGAPHLIALWVAVFSVAANAALYAYTRCVSVEINSPLTYALARHQSSDATASLAVAAGILGSHYLGISWLDPLVAVFETLDLFRLGGEIFWDASQGLMDSSAPRTTIKGIEKAACSVKGALGVEQVKTRRVGQELWVDLVVGVDPEITISQGNKIRSRVERAVLEAVLHIGNINVHCKSPSGSVPELAMLKKELAAAKSTGGNGGPAETPV